MGDESLMIDRYDGRGHLYDLTRFDVEHADKNPHFTEEEEAVEKACDEERYLELYTDAQEAAMYEEEEWKRYYLSLQEGYQAVGFSYDQPQEGEYVETPAEDAVKEEDEPYEAPKELCVPSNVTVPTCKKQNARIMKTASFIAQHGIQMEIMLKTKQSGNSQFDFLHFENELNPYYQHVVSMIKTNKYKPPSEEDQEPPQEENQEYLHPSLSAPSLPPPPPPPSKPIELPKVSIHDTPYGALIKSIKKNSEPIPVPIPPPVLPTPTTSSNQPQPAHPSAFTTTQTVSTSSPTHHYSTTAYNPPPPGTEPVSLPLVSSLNGPAFVDQLYSQPPPPGTEYTDYPQYQPKKERRKKRRSASSDSDSSLSSSSSSSSGSEDERSSRKYRRKSSKSKSKSITSRAEGPNPIAPPPPDVQPIIDRMAMYVAKNGAEFEIVVMSRKDPRFQFLNEYHAYYPYYKLMKDSYLKDLANTNVDQDQDGKSDKSDQGSQRSVSFSIKGRGRDQDAAPSGNSKAKTLFQYDSSEGEEDSQRLPSEPPSEPPSGVASPSVRLSPDGEKEMEEKLKDKLASAMKERLSQSHKEKQLQAERKRKAAMFLNILKSQPSSEPLGPAPLIQPQVEDAAVLYVGEGSASPEVYEYGNSSTSQRWDSSSKKDRSRSPKERKRRRRSPTPPSAYSLDRRSPNRPSPSRWSNRPSSAWSCARERSPLVQWSRRSRDPPRRSRSRSPHRKEEKRKKHKRSKSRSPSRKSSKEKSRSHKSSKEKDKEKPKKDKKKSRHRSKEREVSSASSSKSQHGVSSTAHTNGKGSSDRHTTSSDVDPVELTHVTKTKSLLASAETNAVATSESLTDLSSIPIPAPSNSKTTLNSESKEDLYPGLTSSSGTTSLVNSPSLPLTNNGTLGATPSHPSSLRIDSGPTSSDLMSKVRAMLKKSRELALKEDILQFEDT